MPIVHVSDANFEKEVVESKVPVLVDFWAPWCGPCRMLAPIVEEIGRDYNGRIKVVKLDTQENPQVPTALGIRSIPTLVLFDGRDVADAMVGLRPKTDITKMLDRYLAKWAKKHPAPLAN